MILVSNGRPEQRHNAVAQHLVHRPFVAVHALHHETKHRVQKLLGNFRVEILDQLSRVFDVSKQYGDVLPFAFEATAGSKDFFAEVLRGVGQGCTFPAHDSWRCCYRLYRTSPHQASARLIDDLGVGIENGFFEVCKIIISQVKLPLEDPISHPASTLQHGHGLVE